MDANARTLEAYQRGAAAYAAAQAPRPSPGLTAFMERFSAAVCGDRHVLEIGSATGHDAACLEALGLSVQRSDATQAFVDRLGPAARRLNVLEDDLGGPWDGIYANAVFLHFDAAELHHVLTRSAAATRPGGILAFTVKEGDGAAWSTAKLDRPRHFTYWRAPALRAAVDASAWELTDLQPVAGAKDRWLMCLCERR